MSNSNDILYFILFFYEKRFTTTHYLTEEHGLDYSKKEFQTLHKVLGMCQLHK